jgi:hypothetical protein
MSQPRLEPRTSKIRHQYANILEGTFLGNTELEQIDGEPKENMRSQ